MFRIMATREYFSHTEQSVEQTAKMFIQKWRIVKLEKTQEPCVCVGLHVNSLKKVHMLYRATTTLRGVSVWRVFHHYNVCYS